MIMIIDLIKIGSKTHSKVFREQGEEEAASGQLHDFTGSASPLSQTSFYWKQTVCLFRIRVIQENEMERGNFGL